MAQPAIQTSFNSGEWAPALNARVDLAKYHSGAALLRNFFVDYRGGATTRPGTKYILQCFKSATAVRLISFQASLSVTYILEFGDEYVRFFNNGAPILEPTVAITSISAANPAVVSTGGAHGYSTGDWVYIADTTVQTPTLNGGYYIVTVTGAATYTLTDLLGNVIDTTSRGVALGGTSARVYTITSPYLASELAQLKFAQNVDAMVFTHPNHPPYQLVLNSAADWDLTAIVFGSTATAPTAVVAGSSGAVGAPGTVNYAYVVTSVDANGQESAPTTPAPIANILDIRTTAGTLLVTWTADPGAVSYNVYRAEPRYGSAVPAGSQYGFVGNVTGTSFYDSNIAPDFSSGPPLIRDPFSGSGVQNVTLTTGGTLYNSVPAVSFTASPGVTAQASATLSVYSVTIDTPGSLYAVGNILSLDAPSYGASLIVTSVDGIGGITGVSIYNVGTITGVGTAIPPGSRAALGGSGAGARFDLFWNVAVVALTNPGTGYGVTPTVTFTGGSPGVSAAATATLGAPSAGNPTVPQFHQQRLLLMGPVSSPMQINASQPGAYYNYNVSFPLQPTDAFQGTLVSSQLGVIQSAISQPQGLIILTDQQAWLVNGGSPGSGLDATNFVANAHIFNGAASPPPIVAVDDILYVQAKNSIVRDLIYDFNKQVYTGRDISVLSSHLFYGYQVLEWAFAEEPFKLIWAVRNDGQLLCLTFLKEQELCAWAHSDTSGAFKSVATAVELGAIGYLDAPYFVVQRTVGGQVVQYIERMAELYYPVGVTDAWCVDSGLQYNGAATLSFTGAQHLAGLSCTGLATDDTGEVTVIPEFTMASNGAFTLTAPPAPATGYTRVTVGLAFTPQLKTLAIDLGEPTIQGKMKKINGVTVRCSQTLGLEIGSDEDNLVSMKDLVRGNVGTATNELVTDLVTGDAYSTLDPKWTVPGQYFLQQSSPMPASILGVIPQIVVGDTGQPRK